VNRTELQDLGWQLVDQHRRVRDKSVLSDVFLMLSIGDYEHAITTVLNYLAAARFDYTTTPWPVSRRGSTDTPATRSPLP
jgi:hypothetical protein